MTPTLTEPSRRRPRGGVRRPLLLGAIVALSCVYVGSYDCLSRRSLREDAGSGTECIFYVPMRDVFPADGDARSPVRQAAILRHYALATLFAPLNWIDQSLFGSPPPASCFLMLSG